MKRGIQAKQSILCTSQRGLAALAFPNPDTKQLAIPQSVASLLLRELPLSLYHDVVTLQDPRTRELLDIPSWGEFDYLNNQYETLVKDVAKTNKENPGSANPTVREAYVVEKAAKEDLEQVLASLRHRVFKPANLRIEASQYLEQRARALIYDQYCLAEAHFAAAMFMKEQALCVADKTKAERYLSYAKSFLVDAVDILHIPLEDTGCENNKAELALSPAAARFAWELQREFSEEKDKFYATLSEASAIEESLGMRVQDGVMLTNCAGFAATSVAAIVGNIAAGGARLASGVTLARNIGLSPALKQTGFFGLKSTFQSMGGLVGLAKKELGLLSVVTLADVSYQFARIAEGKQKRIDFSQIKSAAVSGTVALPILSVPGAQQALGVGLVVTGYEDIKDGSYLSGPAKIAAGAYLSAPRVAFSRATDVAYDGLAFPLGGNRTLRFSQPTSLISDASSFPMSRACIPSAVTATNACVLDLGVPKEQAFSLLNTSPRAATQIMNENVNNEIEKGLANSNAASAAIGCGFMTICQFGLNIVVLPVHLLSLPEAVNDAYQRASSGRYGEGEVYILYATASELAGAPQFVQHLPETLGGGINAATLQRLDANERDWLNMVGATNSYVVGNSSLMLSGYIGANRLIFRSQSPYLPKLSEVKNSKSLDWEIKQGRVPNRDGSFSEGSWLNIEGGLKPNQVAVVHRNSHTQLLVSDASGKIIGIDPGNRLMKLFGANPTVRPLTGTTPRINPGSLMFVYDVAPEVARTISGNVRLLTGQPSLGCTVSVGKALIGTGIPNHTLPLFDIRALLSDVSAGNSQLLYHSS